MTEFKEGQIFITVLCKLDQNILRNSNLNIWANTLEFQGDEGK
jgi:hypothetical protein